MPEPGATRGLSPSRGSSVTCVVAIRCGSAAVPVEARIVSDPASCTFDSSLTMVQEGNSVKVLGWYDNEWGYSNRLVDITELVGRSL